MDLWYGTSGPKNARIMIVGEAWGQEEASAQRPFVGSSGQELNRMLAEVGIDRNECFCSNVVAARPQNNQMWRFFHPREEAKEPFFGLHPTHETLGHIARLAAQINIVKPQLIVAAGNYSFWALSSEANLAYKSNDERGKMEGGGRMVPSGIMDYRGSMLMSRPLEGNQYPVMPVIHPAAILRDWSLRAITIHDLKTRIPMALAGDWLGPKFTINIRPSLREVMEYFNQRIHRMDRGEDLESSIDIETMACDNGFRTITCMSFCTEPNNALTLPFIDKRGGDFVPYWSSPREEAMAVRAMLRFLRHPKLGAIGQNFLYDQSYIHDHWGVVPRLSFDTMLAHHLVWPGTPKDLGTLSSLYCKYHRYWKDDNRDWGNKDNPDTHYLYNGEDAIRTFEIARQQRSLIQQLSLDQLWDEEREKHELAFELMTRGVKIDLQKRSELTTQMINAAEEHKAVLLRLFPQRTVDELMEKQKPSKSLWYSSNKQTQFVFGNILQMPIPKNRKTGNLSLDAKALEVLKEKCPEYSLLFTLLENMRTIGVLTRNVLRAPIEFDARMRCSFNPGGTETFRWSSSENPFGRGTNLQNITSGDE